MISEWDQLVRLGVLMIGDQPCSCRVVQAAFINFRRCWRDLPAHADPVIEIRRAVISGLRFEARKRERRSLRPRHLAEDQNPGNDDLAGGDLHPADDDRDWALGVQVAEALTWAAEQIDVDPAPLAAICDAAASRGYGPARPLSAPTERVTASSVSLRRRRR